MVVSLLQQHSPHALPGEFGRRTSRHHPFGAAHLSVPHFSAGLQKGRCWGRRRGASNLGVGAFWPGLSSKPAAVEMEPIEDIDQFEEVLRRSREDDNRAVVVDWVAAWCRKCIYLKPKLEKLATEFPRIKFYTVDVNNVSQALVKRGNISKMPTIQLWKEGEMKAEVIGGHKAWLVVEEVREMIKKHS